MAQRRMFSPDIVGSDAFLEMPPSTQALYFQLGMRADDDGFVNPKMIMRMIGSADDDLKILIGKRFVLPFSNGVIVIKHWRINNQMRKDWYRPTMYIELKEELYLKDNNSYTDNPEQGKSLIEYDKKYIGSSSVPNRNQSIVKYSIINNNKNSYSSKKYPFYKGEEMRKKDGMWFVIPKEGGPWCEFAGKESDIEWLKIIKK